MDECFVIGRVLEVLLTFIHFRLIYLVYPLGTVENPRLCESALVLIFKLVVTTLVQVLANFFQLFV
jgi:hypothetical protein